MSRHILYNSVLLSIMIRTLLLLSDAMEGILTGVVLPSSDRFSTAEGISSQREHFIIAAQLKVKLLLDDVAIQSSSGWKACCKDLALSNIV
jgi:hypothetical protein